MSFLRKNSLNLYCSVFYLDAFLEIKSRYFAGEESEGLEPKCGIVCVVDGTTKGIGHRGAAVCQGF